MEKIFDSIGDLPANVRRRLSARQQRVFRRVFNSAFRRTEGSQADKEASAFAQANAMAGRMAKAFVKIVPIEKIEEEKRIVWGWAYVCEDRDGVVVDHSGDVVDAEEVEKAAHSFVLDSRVGSAMHDGPVGEIVDSVFFSKHVQEALDIDLGKIGWFVGFRVADDAAWEGVKSGKFKAFSIGGNAQTEDIDDASA